MGILNLNIEYLTYQKTQHLKEFDCGNCKVSLNDDDLKKDNFFLGVSDGDNQIEKKGGTYLDQRQPFYTISMLLKAVEHKECPEVERCEDCFTRYRKEEMRKLKSDGKWYCLKTCWTDKTELRRNAVEKVKTKKKIKDNDREK